MDRKIVRRTLNIPIIQDRFFHESIATVRRSLALRAIIKKEKPDVAISIMCRSNIIMALATVNLNDIKVIGSERAYPPKLPTGKIRDILRRIFYRHLDAITVFTPESAQWVARHTKQKNIAIIPNPVNWPIKVGSPIIDPNDVLPKNKKVLLAVGRLSHEKGFDTLIDIFSMMHEHHDQWVLVIVGEGQERQSLTTQIAGHNMQKHIYLPGCAGNIGQWYEAGDLYVLPSRYEGFGNVLIEAMSYGLAAVSFDCDTGPRAIIRHNIDGLLVAATDKQAMKTSLERLMNDDEFREKLASQAFQVRERFSMNKVAKMWENLISEISSK